MYVKDYDSNWSQSGNINVYTFTSEKPLEIIGGGSSYIADAADSRAGWFDLSTPYPKNSNKRILIGIFMTAGERAYGVSQKVYFDFDDNKFVYEDVDLLDPNLNFIVSANHLIPK